MSIVLYYYDTVDQTFFTKCQLLYQELKIESNLSKMNIYSILNQIDTITELKTYYDQKGVVVFIDNLNNIIVYSNGKNSLIN